MTFLLANWRLVLLAVLIGAIGVQTWRLDRSQKAYASLQAEFEQFKGAVAALGEAAKKKAAEQESADKTKKEQADAENAKTRRDLAGIYAAYRSLRDSRGSGGSLLPAAPSGSTSPATAAFDRTGLDRALSEFDRGVTGLLEQGDQAIADLDSAKFWAQGR